MSTRIALVIATILCFFSACYRMPEEGEVSVIPNTNNPAMTRQSGGLMPGVDM